MECYTLYECAADDITDDVRTYALNKDPVARDVRHDFYCKALDLIFTIQQRHWEINPEHTKCALGMARSVKIQLRM
jgi:hypothetical protein